MTPHQQLETLDKKTINHPVFTAPKYEARLGYCDDDPRTLANIAQIRSERPDMLPMVMQLMGFRGNQVGKRRPEAPSNLSIEDKKFQGELARKIPTELKSSAAVAAASFRNLQKITVPDDLTFEVAAEFCPLYLPGQLDRSKLDPHPNGVESIVRSRVGKKWTATEDTLRALKSFLGEVGLKLRLSATFGDMGVLVETSADANPNLIAGHSDTYRNALEKLTSELGIDLFYRNLSELPAPPSASHNVDQFVVVGDGNKIDPTDLSTEGILEILNLPPDGLTSKQINTLRVALTSCGGNLPLWKGLLNTYIHYVSEAVKGKTMHLGMERADWLLAIQSIPSESTLAQIPALNINVA